MGISTILIFGVALIVVVVGVIAFAVHSSHGK